MDQNEIAKLCASLSLQTKDEKLWSVRNTLKESVGRKLDLCLVGKVISTKNINREAFKAVIPRIWQTVLDIEVVQDNIFLFYFSNQGDRFRIMAGGPWSFDNCLLVLEKPSEVGDIAKLGFSRVVFWIQILNASLLCMTKEMGEFLGQLIGELVDIDVGVTGECFGKYVRLKVAIDISKPLERFLRLELFDYSPWLRASGPPGQNKSPRQFRKQGEVSTERLAAAKTGVYIARTSGKAGGPSAMNVEVADVGGMTECIPEVGCTGNEPNSDGTRESKISDPFALDMGSKLNTISSGIDVRNKSPVASNQGKKKGKWKRWAREGGKGNPSRMEVYSSVVDGDPMRKLRSGLSICPRDFQKWNKSNKKAYVEIIVAKKCELAASNRVEDNASEVGIRSSFKTVVAPLWQAPSANYYKINTDAALDLRNNTLGLGVMIKDCHGLNKEMIWALIGSF
ncbi:hypothetical protein EZV62_011164 [Acer yangbiense]|uniref:DUF4283 domain-containing protein n=1 Tax=Acer yangbiense TaxID=1000413 RepID=A0A5C7I4J2_9ROSI|nr:hypothetical protein EZV62_011164 [Acer yangbiense]